jgi:hypothetical protein
LVEFLGNDGTLQWRSLAGGWKHEYRLPKRVES